MALNNEIPRIAKMHNGIYSQFLLGVMFSITSICAKYSSDVISYDLIGDLPIESTNATQNANRTIAGITFDGLR